MTTPHYDTLRAQIAQRDGQIEDLTHRMNAIARLSEAQVKEIEELKEELRVAQRQVDIYRGVAS